MPCIGASVGKSFASTLMLTPSVGGQTATESELAMGSDSTQSIAVRALARPDIKSAPANRSKENKKFNRTPKLKQTFNV